MRDDTVGYLIILAFVAYVGYLVTRPSVSESTIDEALLRQQFSGFTREVQTTPAEKGIMVRQEILYTNQPQMLPVMLNGGRQPTYGDPAAALYQALGYRPGPGGGFGVPDYRLMKDGTVRVPLPGGGMSGPM